MRKAYLDPGVLAVGIVIIITEGFNAVYGYSLGRTEVECYGIAAIGAAFGLVKVCMPFKIAQAWQGRQLARILAGTAIFVACLAVGHFSTIGVISERKL